MKCPGATAHSVATAPSCSLLTDWSDRGREPASPTIRLAVCMLAGERVPNTVSEEKKAESQQVEHEGGGGAGSCDGPWACGGEERRMGVAVGLPVRGNKAGLRVGAGRRGWQLQSFGGGVFIYNVGARGQVGAG